MGEAVESRTEREPDWTDADHRKMQALALYESQLCDQCGFHESLHDPDSNFYLPEWETCPIAKGYATEERKQKKRDGQHDESALSHPGDGRRLLMRRLDEAEVDDLRSRRAERGAGSSPHAASASSSTSKSTATKT